VTWECTVLRKPSHVCSYLTTSHVAILDSTDSTITTPFSSSPPTSHTSSHASPPYVAMPHLSLRTTTISQYTLPASIYPANLTWPLHGSPSTPSPTSTAPAPTAPTPTLLVSVYFLHLPFPHPLSTDTKRPGRPLLRARQHNDHQRLGARHDPRPGVRFQRAIHAARPCAICA
jgi:hypothetical protein